MKRHIHHILLFASIALCSIALTSCGTEDEGDLLPTGSEHLLNPTPNGDREAL